MSDVSLWALLVAVVGGLVVSMGWYTVFAERLASLDDAYADPGNPEAWKIVVELARTLVVAIVLAVAASRMDSSSWTDGAQLGLVAWVGFPVVLLTGSVLWEKVPTRLAAIHAGDWLLKLVGIAILVSVWRA